MAVINRILKRKRRRAPVAQQGPAQLGQTEGNDAGSVSRNTLLVSVALFSALSFFVGTQSQQIYAAIAPVFGIRASADTLDLGLVQTTYQQLTAHYDGDLDKGALVDGAARGMVAASGDRYTVFMDAEETEKFEQELRGEISGVGAELGIRSDKPTILRVLDDSPAKKAGVRVGDIIVAVNDNGTNGLDASSVAEQIRGPEGTSVKLTLRRDDKFVNLTITRAKISDPSVRWSVDDGVGVMIISRFDQGTADLTRQAAKEFIRDGVKSVVIDLRNNGGGYLMAAQEVAGLWLDNKVIVTEKSQGVVTDTIKSDGQSLLRGMKTVVLVNGESASASEIVAGALQDYKVATLVGQKTYGKGTVQQLIELPGGRQLKVTIARWYTPNDRNITAEGIAPDTEVELTAEDVNAGKDPQLTKAKELAR